MKTFLILAGLSLPNDGIERVYVSPMRKDGDRAERFEDEWISHILGLWGIASTDHPDVYRLFLFQTSSDKTSDDAAAFLLSHGYEEKEEADVFFSNLPSFPFEETMGAMASIHDDETLPNLPSS